MMKIENERWFNLLAIAALGTALFALEKFSHPNIKAEENFTNEINASLFKSLLKPLVFKPVSISISKIGLKDVNIVEIGVEEDGRLETPSNYNEVGWYENGPKAGEEGNAILAGHFDRPGGAPAIFYNLVSLSEGDEVEVKDEVGKVRKFKVYEVSYVPVNDPESVTKAYEDSKEPIITLITCGGVWDYKSQDYSKRLLVKARRV